MVSNANKAKVQVMDKKQSTMLLAFFFLTKIVVEMICLNPQKCKYMQQIEVPENLLIFCSVLQFQVLNLFLTVGRKNEDKGFVLNDILNGNNISRVSNNYDSVSQDLIPAKEISWIREKESNLFDQLQEKIDQLMCKILKHIQIVKLDQFELNDALESFMEV